MSGKRKHRQRLEQLEARRRADATRNGVAVNPEALAPFNSYGPPTFVKVGYYVDLPFTCQDCGKEEVWAAEQQKWWYEVAGGSIYSTAARCRACRRARQGLAGPEDDRGRYTSPKQFLERIREGVEPRLLTLGFTPCNRRRNAWFILEYLRPSGLLSIVFDRSILTLSAEYLDDEIRTIATADFGPPARLLFAPTDSQIDERLDGFIAHVIAAFIDLCSHPQ